MINWRQHYSMARHLTNSTSTVSAFRGGIALAPNKQGLSNPIKTVPLPPELLFNAKEPLIEVGDIVLAGQEIAAGVLASWSGRISDVQKNNADYTIKLIPDGTNTFTSAITEADNPMAAIDAAGLAGLGGAGFSTLKKLLSQQQTQLATLVINAAECEPMIACDEALMLENASEVVLGINVLTQITQCKQCIVAIEDTKIAAIESIKKAMAEYADARVQLCIIPTRYPGGAETVLLRQLSGVRITKNQHPADHNMLCFNVATAYSVHHAVKRQPLFGRVVSVAGSAANEPCNVYALFGTSLAHLLKHTNNLPAHLSNNKINRHVAITLGGPLSGTALEKGVNDLPNVAVNAKCNTVIIETTNLKATEQACIRCGDCADVCPESLMPQQLLRYRHSVDMLYDYHLPNCIECRCCDLVCPSSIPLTDYFIKSKQTLKTQQQIQIDAQLAETRFAAREKRLARRAKEREQELLDKKRQVASAPAAMDIKAALARAKSNKPS